MSNKDRQQPSRTKYKIVLIKKFTLDESSDKSLLRKYFQINFWSLRANALSDNFLTRLVNYETKTMMKYTLMKILVVVNTSDVVMNLILP